MRVEQRIGRIDRVGQQHPTIRIVNLHYEDTVEADVYKALRARIDIIHRMPPQILPRAITSTLLSHLGFMPAVVLSGARQTGKSILAGQLSRGKRELRWVTLDDLDLLDAARDDPQALIDGSMPLTIEEVRREPSLLLAVKRAIDRERIPGQFLLTGSANLLLMKRVSESLTGRATYLTLCR